MLFNMQHLLRSESGFPPQMIFFLWILTDEQCFFFSSLCWFSACDLTDCSCLPLPLCSSSSPSAALWHLLSVITPSGNRVDSCGLCCLLLAAPSHLYVLELLFFISFRFLSLFFSFFHLFLYHVNIMSYKQKELQPDDLTNRLSSTTFFLFPFFFFFFADKLKKAFVFVQCDQCLPISQINIQAFLMEPQMCRSGFCRQTVLIIVSLPQSFLSRAAASSGKDRGRKLHWYTVFITPSTDGNNLLNNQQGSRCFPCFVKVKSEHYPAESLCKYLSQANVPDMKQMQVWV